MTLDRRYSVVKAMIENGTITEFRQIFDYIPKSIVANDFAMNYNRFIIVIYRLQEFTFDKIFKLSECIDVDSSVIVNLLIIQYKIDQAKTLNTTT